MTETPANDLNLGHFGTASYNSKAGKWSFTRNPNIGKLEQLGFWKEVIPPQVQSSPSEPHRPLRVIEQATKTLIDEFPDLAPAAKYLPEHEAVSAALTTAIATYDASVGELMSFGSIPSKGASDRRTRQVIASAGGETGNILRLHFLLTERNGWGNDKDTYLEALSTSNGDAGFWNEDAAPIQQVCFSHAEDCNSFLAIRLPARTALFNPVYHLHRKVSAQSRFLPCPPSAFEMCPIGNVPIGDTGNVPHADVAFNPYYQRQIAIVDQEWNWFVFDIDGGHRNRRYAVSRSVTGNMSMFDEPGPKSEYTNTANSAKEDGWARIMWVGDANTILVCSRRHMELFNLKEGIQPLPHPSLIDRHTPNWILDVRRHPTNVARFFVLTSSRLYLLHVTCPNDMPDVDTIEGAHVILTWVHFRAAEDTTLQLYSQITSDEEIIVMIHSRINSLITVYRIQSKSKDIDSFIPELLYISSNPFLLRLMGTEDSLGSQRIAQLHLEKVDYVHRGRAGSPRVGLEYMNRRIQFYQLFVHFDNLCVGRILLYSLATDASDHVPLDVEPTSWATLIRLRILKNCQDTDMGSPEDAASIEPIRLFSATDPTSMKNTQASSIPTQLAANGPSVLQQSPNRSVNTFDFSNLYVSLASTESLHNDEPLSSPTVELTTTMGKIRAYIEAGPSELDHPRGTLQELSGAKLSVADLDVSSAQAEAVLRLGDQGCYLELERIAWPYFLGLTSDDSDEQPTLSSIYDMILWNWMASLPPEVPLRARQSKELLARRIAGEVLLASMRMKRSARSSNSATTEPGPSQDSDNGLPSLFIPSSSLPTSSQSSPSWDAPASTVGFPLLTDPLARLHQYLNTTSHSAPHQPAPTSPNIHRILSHWSPGTDPSLYNYEATERALADEMELDEVSQAKREKARRKKERREKRQRKENQLFESQQGETRPVVLRSSPGPVGLARSSQVPVASQDQIQGMGVGVGGLVVLSQVEPGKHGGRPAKKKGKSRMSGF